MTALLNSTRAELLRLRWWPAVWIMIGAWTLLNITFGYVFPYITYRTGDAAGPVQAVLLADILPAGVPVAVISGMPMFGGAIMMILGAVAVGSGYGWGTWKTVFTQGPRRATAFGGTLLALAVVVVGVVISTFVVDLGVSTLLAAIEGAPMDLASAQSIIEALLAGFLVFGMWTMAGVVVGVLARGPALAVGLGLIWALVVENLLRGVAGLLDWLQPVTDAFPGTAAGSLAGAIGATPVGGDDGTPGVLTVLSGGTATLVLLAYVVVFLAAATTLVSRRDLA